MKNNWNSHMLLMRVQNGTIISGNAGISVLVIYITYDPVIPGKMKTNAHKTTCTKMFRVTSFTSKNWKWPRRMNKYYLFIIIITNNY